jgi:hypothetical protein
VKAPILPERIRADRNLFLSGPVTSKVGNMTVFDAKRRE